MTMQQNWRSLRPFIGAKDFETSRAFYRALGFNEVVLFHNMSLFTTGELSFYLQDAYVKDWIDNTMLFMEVADVQQQWQALEALQLPEKFPGVRLMPIKVNDWGSECFLIDPSGVLWHFGQFTK